MSQEISKKYPMQPVPFRVLKVQEEIHGCHTLTLQPECNIVSSFAPGQFYMLYVFGHGEVPISVSGNSCETGSLMFTIMTIGSVTKALCSVNVGDVVGVRGPFGNGWPLEQLKGRDILIIAGGLGLAPLRPMIYNLISHAADYGAINLLYGTRTPDMVLFQDELASWDDSNDMSVFLTVDSAGFDWQGDVGVVTELIEKTEINPAGTTALICGPEIMMRFTANALLGKGLASSDIYVSMERNMKCALGHCGRCQYGPHFVCKDGPVFAFDKVEHLFKVREL